MFPTFLNDVAGETAGVASKPLVVTYGAAKLGLRGLGKQAMLTSHVFKECVECFLTMLVDELRTSLVHAADGSVMSRF